MGRVYTLDGKLLCGAPEIRIKDKIYCVDDRNKTVEKALKLFKKKSDNDDGEEISRLDELFKLAFGEKYREIEALELPFSAYIRLSELVISAMTGEEPDKKKETAETTEKDSTFRNVV